MRHHKRFLTPEERARITELQDLFIECYVERKKAMADGQRSASKVWRPKLTVFYAIRKRSRNGRY
jgi:hypothetical protein